MQGRPTRLGATVSYNEFYPATGASDWTPYAESIKTKGVKGLVFYGTPQQLAALELALTSMNYKLDWIDANSNAYGAPFIQAAGKSLSFQHNYADIWAVYPLEKAASNPATQQVIDLYHKYAPGQSTHAPGPAGLLGLADVRDVRGDLRQQPDPQLRVQRGRQADRLDRRRPDAPVNLSSRTPRRTASTSRSRPPNGWQPAYFGADNGPYRCDAPVVKLTGSFPQPVTLASVGKSMSDLK